MLLFLQILIAIFIAEMGDKTQLLMIALSSRYRLRDTLIGAGMAILALNGIAVALGALISGLIPMYIIKIIAGIAFFGFALITVKELGGGESDEGRDLAQSAGYPILVVFGTFFLAELGDKTQLAAITFSANSGAGSAVLIWIACSLGLFLADLIGMLLGSFLKTHISGNFINVAAAVIFAVFGLVTLAEGFALYEGYDGYRWPPAVIAAAVWALAAYVILRRGRRDNGTFSSGDRGDKVGRRDG